MPKLREMNVDVAPSDERAVEVLASGLLCTTEPSWQWTSLHFVARCQQAGSLVSTLQWWTVLCAVELEKTKNARQHPCSAVPRCWGGGADGLAWLQFRAHALLRPR